SARISMDQRVFICRQCDSRSLYSLSYYVITWRVSHWIFFCSEFVSDGLYPFDGHVRTHVYFSCSFGLLFLSALLGGIDALDGLYVCAYYRVELAHEIRWDRLLIDGACGELLSWRPRMEKKTY